jgi:hypothetical protein
MGREEERREEARKAGGDKKEERDHPLAGHECRGPDRKAGLKRWVNGRGDRDRDEEE